MRVVLTRSKTTAAFPQCCFCIPNPLGSTLLLCTPALSRCFMSAAAASSPPPLKGPKTAVISGGRRKVHSDFVDGTEMVEEFDVVTDELLLRKRRKPTTLGGEGNWIVEVGQEDRAFIPERDLLCESSSMPVVVRKDTNDAIVFRVRNLPYPKDVYSVTLSGDRKAIVVRTSNRKYFKQLDVPDLTARGGLTLDPSLLTWDHQMNTLIVTYAKPQPIKIVEMQEKRERAAMKATRIADNGDVSAPGAGCPQQ